MTPREFKEGPRPPFLANRSFRLRGTRITDAQQSATDKYWQEFGIEPDHKIIPAEIFPNSKEVVLEIGSGMGEATAIIAHTFGQIGYLAVEVHRPGIGSLLGRISELELTNIRIINEDARVVMSDLMPDQCLDAIHLYFPDPWPKSKHWKRRIIQEDFLALVWSKLKPGGYIHIATDWVAYSHWIEEKFAASAKFEGGEIAKPDFRPTTRFEQKGITKDHKVRDFKYFRKG